MTHHDCRYPDRAWQGTVWIDQNERLAEDTYRIRVSCPPIAARILPGQFAMLRLPESTDPLLGRPLAVYDVLRAADGTATGLDFVYLAIGKMTRRLAKLAPGAPLEIWGPLGNGFPPTPTDHLVMVAGGIGQTPFLCVAKEYLGLDRYGQPPRLVPRAAKVSLLYGARNQAHLACVEDFRRLGVDVHLSTDDGSAGHRGLVTELIEPAVAGSPGSCRIVCCGPEAMIAATARTAAALGVPCQVSLESPMACGIGICFSCVVKVREGAGWDYRRTCVEGPVFEAQEVDLD